VLELPLGAAGAVFVVGSALLTALFAIVTRGPVRRAIGDEHNTVVGQIFAAQGVVYAVVLAFVVFAVWTQWGVADASVVAEGAAAITAYRATEDLPPPQRKPAQEALRGYVRSTIKNEWASHAGLGPHASADDLNAVWAAFRAAKPTEAVDVAAMQNALGQLSELERARHMLHLAREGTLPPIFWLILLAGGAVTVGFSYFLVMQNAWVHALTSALLAASLAALLLLIFALNFPFTGTVHVSQQPLEHALLMFDQIDRG
jgi:hypothetical protein